MQSQHLSFNQLYGVGGDRPEVSQATYPYPWSYLPLNNKPKGRNLATCFVGIAVVTGTA